MTYNILKRQADAVDHGLPERANVSDFFKCCKLVYQNIEKALNAQDHSYGEMSKFGSTFSKNPFFVNFCSHVDGDEFALVLAELATALVRETSALRRDEDILGTGTLAF